MNFEKKPINEIKKPMNDDYLEIKNSDGMPAMVDSTIALSFMLNVKSGIRNCAIALTEIEDQEARDAIKGMLNRGIDMHTQISELMMTKGWFYPYEVKEQFGIDQMAAQAATQIANLELFPGDTSRLGMFTTPNY